MKKEKYIIVKLDCDDPVKIVKFRELWNEIVDDVIFVPKTMKFKIEGKWK